jgi:hypothetical protein
VVHAAAITTLSLSLPVGLLGIATGLRCLTSSVGAAVAAIVTRMRRNMGRGCTAIAWVFTPVIAWVRLRRVVSAGICSGARATLEAAIRSMGACVGYEVDIVQQSESLG